MTRLARRAAAQARAAVNAERRVDRALREMKVVFYVVGDRASEDRVVAKYSDGEPTRSDRGYTAIVRAIARAARARG